MIFLGWTVAIFFLLLRPSDGEMGWLQQIPHFDKLVHFSLFLIWAILASLAIPSQELKSKVLLVMVVLCFAFTTEWLQSYVPTRTPDWKDIVADAVGGLLGIVLTKFWKINQ